MANFILYLSAWLLIGLGANALVVISEALIMSSKGVAYVFHIRMLRDQLVPKKLKWYSIPLGVFRWPYFVGEYIYGSIKQETFTEYVLLKAIAKREKEQN